MAEQLQAAQIKQSADAMLLSSGDTSRGHWLGFATTAFAMVGALISLRLQYPWVAGAFLSVPVMAVAKALVETTKAPSQTDIIKAAAEVQAAPQTPQPDDSQPRVSGGGPIARTLGDQ
jgi:hypothetical protein